MRRFSAFAAGALLALATPAAAGSVLGERFVRLDRGRPRPAALLPQTRLVALYYGAGWCGPCRAFVPELIAAYPRLRANGVEVIFVSDDATCGVGRDYARASRMPWLLLPCDAPRRARLRKLAGVALPGLVGVDRDGRRLQSSWDERGVSTPRRTLHTLLNGLSASGAIRPPEN